MSEPRARRGGLIPFAIWTLICLLSVGTFAKDIVPGSVAGLGLNQIVLLGLLPIMSLLSLYSGAGRLLVGPLPMLLLVGAGWAALSAVWSQNPIGSLVKGLTLVMVVLSVAWVVVRLNAKQVVQGILLGAVIALVISLVAVILLPNLAGTTDFHPGAWRGIYGQKNVLGRGALIATAISMVLAMTERSVGKRLGYALVGAFALFMLLRSTSATALLAVGLFFVGYPFFLALSRAPTAIRLLATIALFIGLVLLVPAATTAVGAAAGELGRDASLTGRVPLWIFALGEIAKRPLLGYGFDAYFLGTPESDAYLLAHLRWVPEMAHNGLIDLLLELGIVGAVIVFSSVIALLARVSKASLNPYTRSLVIATFLLMLFMNITESNFFRPSNLLWIMFIVAALRVHYEGVVRMSNAARQPRPRPVRMEQRA